MVVDRAAGGFRVAEVRDPAPGPGQVLVRVAAFSLNAGEVRDALEHAPEGTVCGWESAGEVVRPAADGTGPAVGTPVAGFTLGGGGWAQYVAVDVGDVALIGSGADPGAASTVVIAGASALRALRRLGPVVGERVLVTGATGGVGRYAVQLARLAGARPVAVTRRPDRDGAALRVLGAEEVYGDVAEVPPGLRGAIDSVGGPVLTEAYARLGERGTLVTVGQSSGHDAVLPAADLIGRFGGHDRTLATFFLPSTGPGLGADRTWLAARVGDGTLDPGITWRRDWSEVGDATRALLEGGLGGKAVADVDGLRDGSQRT